MMGALDGLLLIPGILFLAAVGYLWFLAVVSLRPETGKRREYPPTVTFAVVIPAHNESRVIARTLESLLASDYPRDRFEVFVIADNCDDDTAAVARRSGVICWERKDSENRGKGYVLRWAFDRLLQEGGHDAFVVIDADTVADRRFLRAVNDRLCGGAQAVQGYYDVLHPERSPMGSLSYLGFMISRNLRYRGRTRLGWTTNLLGNGMAFSREVIARFGWCATSIVEDIEYEMILHLNGIRVAFAPEARIYAEIPDTFRTSRVQRGRWDVGKFEVRNQYVFQLLKSWVRTRDFSYLDSALELLIPPFSLFVALILAGTPAVLLLTGLSGWAGPVWVTAFLGVGGYTLLGLMLARPHPRVYVNLLYAPYFILWRIWVVFRGMVSGTRHVWVKTERR